MVLKWGTLFALVLAAMLSFIDRQILSLVVGPVKADLGLSDVEISLLQGFAFAVFYAVAAVPFGWLADRFARKWIICCGIVFWSLMTFLSGFARSFGDLFAARLGVGLGEATLGPSVHSMIADLFKPDELPVAMSIYGFGVSIGAGLAFLIGGQIIDVMSKAPPLVLPAIGSLEPWQLAFMIVGLPGLFLALLMALFLKEPPRVGKESLNSPAQNSLFEFSRQNRQLCVCVISGLSLLSAASYAHLAWMAAFFERSFFWSAGQSGVAIGAMLICAGVTGGATSGSLAGLLIKRGRRDGAIIVAAAFAVISSLFAAIGFLMPSGGFAIGFLAPSVFFGTAFVGLGPAIVQAAIPTSLRGQASAWQLVLTSLIGMTAGPLGVALLTDLVFQDEALLGYSLSVMSLLFGLSGAALLMISVKPFSEALSPSARAGTSVAASEEGVLS